MILHTWRKLKERVTNYLYTSHDFKARSARLILGKLNLLRDSDRELNKSLILIIFSLYISAITSMTSAQLMDLIIRHWDAVFGTDEIVLQPLLSLAIALIGLFGGLYMLAGKRKALWLLSIWAGLMIIPYNFTNSPSPTFMHPQCFSAYNIAPFFNILQCYSRILSSTSLTDLAGGYSILVNYKPIIVSVGINYVPIFYLIILAIIYFTNLQKSNKLLTCIYVLAIMISVALPYGIFRYTNAIIDQKKEQYDDRLFIANAVLNYYKWQGFKLADKTKSTPCERAAAIYKMCDPSDLVKRITCEDKYGRIVKNY